MRLNPDEEREEQGAHHRGGRIDQKGINMRRKSKRYTQEEKAELVQKVDSLRATGLAQKAACKQVGVNFTSYYKFKHATKGMTKKRKYIRRAKAVEPDLQFTPEKTVEPILAVVLVTPTKLRAWLGDPAWNIG